MEHSHETARRPTRPDQPSGERTVRQNLRSLMQAQLSKLDVVSREEFEAQQAVLQRTREQLADLEQQLADLESRLKP